MKPILKKRKPGEPFPSDFWNYTLNPILGYEYKLNPRVMKDEEKGYYKTSQPTK
tara:strand:+ start:2813 stop:2974 length:162 start_codon:yes stop_codon:yes gene_type:complete